MRMGRAMLVHLAPLAAIRFTHLENRLKDKDLDDSRSAEDRYVLGSMFVEEIRLFALRKE
jgi:hypothetical protein